MSDFTLILKSHGMHLTRAQLEAITKFGSENGGTLELSESRFGMVRVRDRIGQETIIRSDGHVDRLA